MNYLKKLMSFYKNDENHVLQKSNTSNSYFISCQKLESPVWTSSDFVNQVDVGYKKNPVVYRCINIIARNMASVSLDITAEENNMDDSGDISGLQSLIACPNPFQNKSCFFESMVSHLMISGEVFIHGVKGQSLAEMYILPADRVRIVHDQKGFPFFYEYMSGKSKRKVIIDPETGHSDILHIKFFNPLDDRRGMSPLSAAQTMIDLHNEIVGHNISLLQNAGCPSGALMVKDARLTPNQQKDLQDQLSHFKKNAGAGKMLFLDGQFEWKEMGLSPKEMDFDQGKNVAARSIAQVFGVPPMCVGLLGDSTYSNYQESHMHLWEGTILPLLDFILSHINRWIQKYYDHKVSISYQKDHIHALIPRREKAWDRVSKIGCLTINEKRNILGYPPIEGGDTLGQGGDRAALLEQQDDQ